MLKTALILAAISTQSPSQELSDFLRDRLRFSNSDISRVERGEVVTRNLDADGNKEVAVVGVVRLEASREQFLERFRDIENFARTPELTQIGRFTSPPGPENLAALTLTDDEFDAMRGCRSRDCDVKLSAARIAELRAMDWEVPGHEDRLADLARSWLLDYVRDYLDRGNEALVIYDDRDQPQPLHDGFHALLAESPYVFEYVPEFHHYLDEYPNVALPGSEDFLYWAVQDVGLKPITSVTHATIYRRTATESPQTLIALKQIYANHYFHAALKLMALVDTADGTDGFYLVYLDRSLFDTKIGWLQRGTVEGRLRESLESRLEAIRQQLAEGG